MTFDIRKTGQAEHLPERTSGGCLMKKKMQMNACTFRVTILTFKDFGGCKVKTFQTKPSRTCDLRKSWKSLFKDGVLYIHVYCIIICRVSLSVIMRICYSIFKARDKDRIETTFRVIQYSKMKVNRVNLNIQMFNNELRERRDSICRISSQAYAVISQVSTPMGFKFIEGMHASYHQPFGFTVLE